MDLENLDYNMRLFILVVFAVVYSQQPPAFGTLLGSYQGVDAYSNFRSETNGINYEYENYQDGIYTGLKYECVEYARRFLITRKNLTFESLPCALDIWHLNFLLDINTENQVLLKRIQNGSKCEPIEGDLLIYRKNSIAEYGHVAIITEVSKAQ
jgi:glutathionylspermidine amidase/synthetase